MNHRELKPYEAFDFSDELWASLCGMGRPVFFPANSTIYLQDTPSEGLYCIDSGRIKNYRIMDDGNEVIFTLYSGRVIIGEAAVIRNELNITSATALTNVHAYLIPIDVVQEQIEKNHELTKNLLKSITKKLRTVTMQNSSNSGKKLIKAIAQAILMLDHYGVVFNETENTYTITHAELASIVGTTRSHLTTELNRLAAEGLIELKRNRIRILKESDLNDLANR